VRGGRVGPWAGTQGDVGVVNAPALAVRRNGDRVGAPGEGGLALWNCSELAHPRFACFEGPLDYELTARFEGAASFVEGRDDVGGEVAAGRGKETNDEVFGAN
jgi:hypothetical protein